MTLNELLIRVKNRPGAFLGNDINLKSLSHFITGFLYSKSIFSELNNFEKQFKSNFRNFVISELPYQNKCHFDMANWDDIILLLTKDDNESLKLFFEIYEHYCKRFICN